MEDKSVKMMNKREKRMFCLRKAIEGEAKSTITKKNKDAVIDVIQTRVNTVFIFSIFRSEPGRYLIKLFPNPRRLKVEIKVVTEMSVVAIPT